MAIAGEETSVKNRYQSLAVSYLKVFDPESSFVHAVLVDLAKFCRAHESTFHPDPRVHALKEGRREVWLKIIEHLNLSVDEIYKLHVVKELSIRSQKKG